MKAAVPEQLLTTTVKSLKNDTKSPIVAPIDIKTNPFDDISVRASDSYQHLWLAFTEEDEKFEYSLRYNSSRSGFWLASPPHARKLRFIRHFIISSFQTSSLLFFSQIPAFF